MSPPPTASALHAPFSECNARPMRALHQSHKLPTPASAKLRGSVLSSPHGDECARQWSRGSWSAGDGAQVLTYFRVLRCVHDSLATPEQVQALIDYVVTEPPEDSEGKVKFIYPYKSSEVVPNQRHPWPEQC